MNYQDESIEALLRKQFKGAVADDGFSERVMRRLPARRRFVVWPLWVGVLAGTVAAWLSVGNQLGMHVHWHDWAVGSFSASAMVLLLASVCLSLLACWWGLAEADDR
jgi:hypothetical protein